MSPNAEKRAAMKVEFANRLAEDIFELSAISSLMDSSVVHWPERIKKIAKRGFHGKFAVTVEENVN